MFNRKKRLSQAHKMLAVDVAKDLFPKSGGNRVEFERLLRADNRVKMIDPMLIILFIRVAMLVFEYFRNKPVSGVTAVNETNEDIYTNSLKYEDE